ncbi:MAG: endonuclease III [Methanomassiliicoccus sp.]|nr:endonuclease III [Methanomassiliicoccus sp.]
MAGKPINEILDRLERRSRDRASPGSALGREPSWQRTPFTVLIATVLSQRNRDECTYLASEKLFSHHDTPAKLMAASEDEVDGLIRTVNFHRGKAKAIREISRIIHVDHGDRVPDDIDGLMALPMVGRKTANCVLAYAFYKDAICVDIHVHRISNRIGLVKSSTPEGTEEQLKLIVPQERWRTVNELMVRFGQEVCTPLHPRHALCPIRELCDHYLQNAAD